MLGPGSTAVPPALVVAEQILSTIVDPETPPVPRWTVWATPVVAAPDDHPIGRVRRRHSDAARSRRNHDGPAAVNLPEYV
jgi:hypothetical protein